MKKTKQRKMIGHTYAIGMHAVATDALLIVTETNRRTPDDMAVYVYPILTSSLAMMLASVIAEESSIQQQESQKGASGLGIFVAKYQTESHQCQV